MSQRLMSFRFFFLHLFGILVICCGGIFSISAASNDSSLQTFAVDTQSVEHSVLNQVITPEIHEQQILTPDDFYDRRSFGNAVDIDGNTAVIAANRSDIAAGSAYVFIRQGSSWVQQAKLTAPDVLSCDFFGFDVAISGDTILVGATGCQVERMAAYIFVRNGTTWTQQAKITVPDMMVVADGINIDVDLVGDTALIGNAADSQKGAVYVFVRTGATWVEQARLRASDGQIGDGFGASFQMDGERLLIGAPHNGGNVPGKRGAAYVFARSGSTWTQQAKITADDNFNTSMFGSKVALDANTAVIADDSYGLTYIFANNNGSGWTHQSVLTQFSMSSGSNLTIAVEGNTVVVGDGLGRGNRGIAYKFTKTGSVWSKEALLTPGDPYLPALFGRGLAIGGGTILIGAPRHAAGQGQAYIFASDSNPVTELLVNGGFEVDSNGDFVPDGWTRKNPTGDGRRCNQAGQPAYEGQCTYRFKDDASGNNKLVQNVDLNVHDLNAGDKVKLTGFYNKQSTGSIQVRLFVTYASLPEDQQRITVTAATTGYKALPALAITLKAKPTRVRVQIQNETTSGKTWFDGLSLKLTDNSNLAPLIPLPLP